MLLFYPLTQNSAHILHGITELAAIFIGMQCYWRMRPKSELSFTQSVYLLVGVMVGSAIFCRLIFWLEIPQGAPWNIGGINELMVGQSIIGGLLGGLVGIEIVKKLTGIKQSTGDAMVLPIVIGLSIGRVGCYLAGLHDGTFGIETTVPWAIDFGDGVFRHPTQLYEIIFLWALYGVLKWCRSVTVLQNGLQFKLFLSSYLLWRLWVESIKPIPYEYAFGLSGLQWVCLIALIIYLPLVIRDCALCHQKLKAA